MESTNEAALRWHDYRYFPYEKDFARRELEGLFNPASILETDSGLVIQGKLPVKALERLAYFSRVETKAGIFITKQSALERACLDFFDNGKRKQSTRYSVHGLHEYKGKFNPQVVRGLLNILGIRSGTVLDPFCGSGTTLVECAHLGIEAVGFDINPLAAYIAKAKLTALTIAADELGRRGAAVVRSAPRLRRRLSIQNDDRSRYLADWFGATQLIDFESLRAAILNGDPDCAPVFFVLASDLLRTYSLQEPMDLRIRRRKSPFPSEPITDAFKRRLSDFIIRLKLAQNENGVLKRVPQVVCHDVRKEFYKDTLKQVPVFVGAITSPPYATALPYIDTQRLSLVWLGLCEPNHIRPLEAALIGTRELRGKANLSDELEANEADLPEKTADYCRDLLRALGLNDGFRRRAVPFLLYKYFTEMQQMFKAVARLMRPKAPFALIVGGNHTVLSGKRFDINTPSHLADIALSAGWRLRELVPLQTYQRYGLHSDNAVSAESLISLEKL